MVFIMFLNLAQNKACESLKILENSFFFFFLNSLLKEPANEAEFIRKEIAKGYTDEHISPKKGIKICRENHEIKERQDGFFF